MAPFRQLAAKLQDSDRIFYPLILLTLTYNLRVKRGYILIEDCLICFLIGDKDRVDQIRDCSLIFGIALYNPGSNVKENVDRGCRSMRLSMSLNKTVLENTEEQNSKK